MDRPFPSTKPYNSFIPCAELTDWVFATFIKDKSPLFNAEYSHLLDAKIGFLWAYEPNLNQGKQTLGTAEIFRPKGNKWQTGRQKQQVKNWFSYLWDKEKNVDIPNFIITIDANFALKAKDNKFCALVEHELTHCAQARDEFGMPKFSNATGKPIFTIREHDVQVFINEIERYGLEAVAPEVAELVAKANQKPLIKMDSIIKSCGTCSFASK